MRILTGMTMVCVMWLLSSTCVAQEPSVDELLVNDVSEEQMNEPLPVPPPVVKTDWFAEFEKLYIDRLDPPEENGMRDVIASLGPVGLEQNALVWSVAWEDFPTDERSSKWYHDSWMPICERLGINPAVKPAWLGYRSLEEYFRIYGFTGDEPVLPEDMNDRWLPSPDVRYPDMPAQKLAWDQATRRASRLRSVPWTAKDSPVAARWVEETSPLLDIWGNAVRKPQFVGYSLPATSLIAVLLPEIQSQRELARGMATRVDYIIGIAEPGSSQIDDAIHDVQTLLLFNRKHFQYSTFLVTRLVGIAIEGIGQSAALTLLRSEKMSDAQLERLATILAELNPPAPLDRCMKVEMMIGLQVADQLLFDDTNTKNGIWFDVGMRSYTTNILRSMRFNQALIHEKIRAAYAEAVSIGNEPDHAVFLERLRQRDEQLSQRFGGGGDAQIWWMLGSIMSVQKRSEVMGDLILGLLLPATGAFRNAVDRVECGSRLLETGIALERYCRKNGAYPESLDALVAARLIAEEKLVDPFTGGPFTYRAEPFTPPTPDPEEFAAWKEEMEGHEDGPQQIVEETKPGYSIFQNLCPSPYLLHSVGQNGVDDTARWLLPENRVYGRNPTDWMRGSDRSWSNSSDDMRL